MVIKSNNIQTDVFKSTIMEYKCGTTEHKIIVLPTLCTGPPYFYRIKWIVAKNEIYYTNQFFLYREIYGKVSYFHPQRDKKKLFLQKYYDFLHNISWEIKNK